MARSSSRRWFVTRVPLAVVAAPLAAHAQQAGRVYRLGWIAGAPPPPGVSPKFPFLVRRLRELGYVEGKNLTIEERFGGVGGPDFDRYGVIVRELVDTHKVDVLTVLGNRIARIAQQTAPNTPIVLIGGVDPVKEGLVASLARPGSTITGVLQGVGHDVMVKLLQVLKEAVPGRARFAVVVGAQPHFIDNYAALRPAAAALGVDVHQVAIESPVDFEPAFEAIARNASEAIVVLPTPAVQIRPHPFVELAARHRIPAAYWWTDIVHLGGLMAYGVDWAELARRAATYVDRIFKGAKPGDLPIEQPKAFELLVNAKTAKGLGITIPKSVLLRAGQVIE